MAYPYATAGSTTKVFPIGKGLNYSPISLSLTQNSAIISYYTAELFNTAPPKNSLPGTLDKVSSSGYYSISESGSGSPISSGRFY